MISELDKILDNIPQAGNPREGLARGKEAMLYINNSGDLCILIDEVGMLTILEDDLPQLNAFADPE